MRFLAALFVVFWVVSVVPAHAQVPSTTPVATVTVEMPAAQTANGTAFAVIGSVALRLSDHICPAEETYNVGLTATVTGEASGNGSMNQTAGPAATIEPSSVTFRVPSGAHTSQTPWQSDKEQFTVTGGGSGNATVKVVATFAAQTDCVMRSVAQKEATASTAISFALPPPPPPPEPEEKMPGPAFAFVLAALALGLVRRRA